MSESIDSSVYFSLVSTGSGVRRLLCARSEACFVYLEPWVPEGEGGLALTDENITAHVRTPGMPLVFVLRRAQTTLCFARIEEDGAPRTTTICNKADDLADFLVGAGLVDMAGAGDVLHILISAAVGAWPELEVGLAGAGVLDLFTGAVYESVKAGVRCSEGAAESAPPSGRIHMPSSGVGEA